MTSTFSADALAAMRDADIVVIETSSAPGRAVRETVIWIVVDDQDRPFVRSVRGARGRWYRDLVANPSGGLRIGEMRVPIVGEAASDAARVDACSEALRAKYRTQRASLAAMLLEETLPTTLELRPG
jgi:hypothetical protein